MTLEKQVTGLDISQRLKELGVKQESLFWWYSTNNGWMITAEPANWMDEKTSAFTVAELGELLPAHFEAEKFNTPENSWWCMRENIQAEDGPCCSHETEAEQRGLMLIRYLEAQF